MPHATARGWRAAKLASIVAALAGAALLITLIAQNGPAKAGAFSEYPALQSSSGPGLTIAATPAEAAAATGPAYAANVPDAYVAAHRPEADSIRPVEVGSRLLSTWIARDPEGGVCVLASRKTTGNDGASPLAYSCSTADSVNKGAMVEISEVASGHGEILFAGVVPAGVPSVTLRLADGSSVTAPVQDGGWSAGATSRARGIAQNVDGAPHETVVGQ